MLYMKYTTFLNTIYVIIITKYTPECTKLQHLKFISRSDMLAVAFSPHRGLEVKESNPLLAFGQSKLWDLLKKQLILRFTNVKKTKSHAS